MSDIISDIIVNLLLFIGAFIILRKIPRRKYFYVRAAAAFAAFTLLRMGIFQGLTLLLPRDVIWIKNIFGFIILFGLTTASVAVCFKCDFATALFGGSASYCVQHMCQRTYLVISRFFPRGTQEIFYVMLFVALGVAYLTALYFIMERVNLRRITVNNVYLLVLAIVVIATTVVLDMVFMHYNVGGEYRRVLSVCTNISSILMSGMIFALLLSIVMGKRFEAERDIIKEMLDDEREQYYFEKSMIDAINIKCHDLKHQIAALDGEKAKALKQEVNAIVDRYNAKFQTGNAALDTILTRTNFVCLERKIELTCNADGAALGFVSEVDTYSLFGNILDNAIEAVEKMQDENKRVIILAVEKHGNFVYVHAENYFSGQLNYQKGEISTTKTDSALHGYGLKSIRMIVEKYDGNLLINVKDGNRFCLEIMFPV